MPTYLSGGARLSYQDELGPLTLTGRSQPIIVLAGGAGRHPSYLGDLAGLGQSRRLVIPHQRGVGRSPLPANPAEGSSWSQADDIEALRRHLGLDRLTLLGHSAGARLATAYAAQHPGRLESMVLVTPPAAPLVDVSSDAGDLVARRRGETAFDDAVRLLGAGPSVSDDDELTAWQRSCAPATYARWGTREREHAHVGRYSLAAARAYFSVAPPPDLAQRLAQFTGRVLVIAGAEDCLTGVAPLLALGRLFPEGRTVVLDGCGHYPWVEQPNAFRATVDAFLTSRAD